jgi:stage III sporulation protein SpoIIIAA
MRWCELQEAAACRTIAQRGVLLVSTSHGNSLDDLLRNPDLQGLVWGVKAVTLGDRLAADSNGGHKVRPLYHHTPAFLLVILTNLQAPPAKQSQRHKILM